MELDVQNIRREELYSPRRQSSPKHTFSFTVLSQPPKEQNDSGYGVELVGQEDDVFQTTSADRIEDVLVLQRNRHSSTLSRGQRYRNSLRKLRQRSGDFVQKRIRPSCLRASTADELDAAGGEHRSPSASRITRRLGDAPTPSPVTLRTAVLVRQNGIEEHGSTDFIPSPWQCPSNASSRSGRTFPSADDVGITWINSATCSRQTTPATSSEVSSH